MGIIDSILELQDLVEMHGGKARTVIVGDKAHEDLKAEVKGMTKFHRSCGCSGDSILGLQLIYVPGYDRLTITHKTPGEFIAYSIGQLADTRADLATAESAVERLMERCEKLEAVATAAIPFMDRYISLIDSGDCGNWEPRDEPEVKALTEALTAAGYLADRQMTDE